MAKKTRKFQCPGIFHPLSVKLVSEKWLQKNLGGPCVGAHVHGDGLVYVALGLTPQVRKHVFYHEISHHILDTLSAIKDEEQQCDLLATYLMNLIGAAPAVEAKLNSEDSSKAGSE
jgi:hypothetical protein